MALKQPVYDDEDTQEWYDEEFEKIAEQNKELGKSAEDAAKKTKSALEQAEDEATSVADDRGGPVTREELEELGFNYKRKEQGGSFRQRFFGNRQAVRRTLIGGGIGASIIGFVVSLIISFLPLKLEFIIQNITQSVTAATYETIEDRFEHMLGNYITRRLYFDGPGRGPSYRGNSLFDTMYGNFRSANFEQQLFDRYGIQFEALDINTATGEFDVIRDGSRTPNGWRVKTVDGVSDAIRSSKVDLSLLDTELDSKDIRRTIRKTTREMTLWYQVIKRRNLRRILQNKYDVPDWKVPDSVRDATKSYRDKKIEAKKWLVKRSIGPFSTRYAAFFTCILDSRTCGSLLDQSNPDLRPGDVGDGTDGAPPDRSDFDSDSDYNDALENYRRRAGGDVNYKAASEVVDEFVDIIDGGVDVGPRLAKLLSQEFTKKLLGSAAAGIGLINLIANFEESCIQEGACARAATEMKMLNAASAAIPFLTTNSQYLAGEITSEEFGVFMDALQNATEHPIWAREFGTLRDAAAEDDTQTVAYDCDSDPETPDDLVTLAKPVCSHEYIRVDFGSFRDNPVYSLWLGPVLEYWRNSVGLVVNLFEGAFDFLLGPIVEWLLNRSGIPYEEWTEKAISFVLEKVFGPTCTGAEVDGAMLSCIRSGIEVAYNELSSEVVNGIGGMYMNARETFYLQKQFEEQLAWEWQQEPLTTRLFSTDNHQSLLAKAVLNTPDSMSEVSQNIAGLFANPLNSVGSLFSRMAGPVDAQVITNYNPYGLVKFGYPADHPAMNYDPDNPQLEECQYDVQPESYEDERVLEDVTIPSSDFYDPDGPVWEVPVTTDPCALDRTVVETSTAIFGDGSAGIGFDYFDDAGSEFYTGDYDEVFDTQLDFAGATP